jgi:hypothetical protein
MNPLFNPTSARTPRTDLEKVRKLVKAEDPSPPPRPRAAAGLPTNWLYDEAALARLWRELESHEVAVQLESSESTIFKNISEITIRLKEAIRSYEADDQTLLMTVMDIVGDNSRVLSLDQHDLLFEAKQILTELILEHVDKGDEQSRLLEGLRHWLGELNMKRTPTDVSHTISEDILSIETLTAFIFDLKRMKESRAEKAATIHEDIVRGLMKQLNEMEKLLQERSWVQAHAQMSGNMSDGSRGRRRPVKYVPPPGTIEADLLASQRQVLELKNKVVRLQQYLTEYAAAHSSAALPEWKSMDSDLTLFSLDKDVETDQKVQVLTDEVDALKRECKTLQHQLARQRQGELVIEKRLMTSELARKAAEASIIIANARIAELQKQCAQIVEMQGTLGSDDTERVLDTARDYEERIERLMESHRQELRELTNSDERKYQQRLSELADALASGDSKTLMEQMIAQMTQQRIEMEQDAAEQWEERGKAFHAQLMTVSKNYERIIQRREQEKEMIIAHHNAEVEMKIAGAKADFESDKLNALMEAEQRHAALMSDMRLLFISKIDRLQRKLKKTTRQRDSMAAILKANMMTSNLFDALHGEEEEEEETEDDNVLADSLAKLKEREIEQRVQQKNADMMKRQKEFSDDLRAWEARRLQEYYAHKQDAVLSGFREDTLSDIQEISASADSPSDVIDSLLSTVVKRVSDFGGESESMGPMIPLAEVDKKMDSFKAEILKLRIENDTWRKTFDGVAARSAIPSTMALVEELKASLSSQAEEIADLRVEKQAMQREMLQQDHPSLISFSGHPKCTMYTVTVFRSKGGRQPRQARSVQVDVMADLEGHPVMQSASLVTHRTPPISELLHGQKLSATGPARSPLLDPQKRHAPGRRLAVTRARAIAAYPPRPKTEIGIQVALLPDPDFLEIAVPIGVVVKIPPTYNPRMKQCLQELEVKRVELRTIVLEMLTDQRARMKQLCIAMHDMLKRHAQEFKNLTAKSEDLRKMLRWEQQKSAQQQKTIVSQEGLIEDLQHKIENFIARVRLHEAELIALHGQMDAVSQSENQATEFIENLQTMILQLREQANSRTKHIVQLEQANQSYLTDKELQYARKGVNLEMTPQPIIIFTTNTARVRVVVTARETTVHSARRPGQVFVPRGAARVQAKPPPEASGPEPESSIYPGFTPSRSESDDRPLKLFSESMHLKQPEVNQQFFSGLEKRIHSLERQMQEKNLMIQAERDRCQTLNQMLVKVGIANQQLTREVTKASLMNERTKVGFAKVVALVNERDSEIEALRRQIQNYHAIAGTVTVHQAARGIEPSEKDSVLTKLVVALNDDSVLARMAHEEVQSMRRVEEARNRYIRQEQTKILGALDAMCFLTQSASGPAKAPIRVSTIKKKREQVKHHPSVKSVQSHSSSGSKLMTRVVV